MAGELEIHRKSRRMDREIRLVRQQNDGLLRGYSLER
jgi:hypothetical protein